MYGRLCVREKPPTANRGMRRLKMARLALHIFYHPKEDEAGGMGYTPGMSVPFIDSRRTHEYHLLWNGAQFAIADFLKHGPCTENEDGIISSLWRTLTTDDRRTFMATSELLEHHYGGEKERLQDWNAFAADSEKMWKSPFEITSYVSTEKPFTVLQRWTRKLAAAAATTVEPSEKSELEQRLKACQDGCWEFGEMLENCGKEPIRDDKYSDNALFKVNLLAFFAASLALYPHKGESAAEYIDGTIRLFRDVVDVYGPGSCLAAINTAANSMENLEPHTIRLRHLQDLILYKRLVDAAARRGVNATLYKEKIRCQVAKRAGIPLELTTGQEEPSAHSSSLQSSTSLTPFSTSSSTTAVEKERLGNLPAILKLPEYDDLLWFFCLAKEAAWSQSIFLRNFVDYWAMRFKAAGISIQKKQDIVSHELLRHFNQIILVDGTRRE